MFHIIVEEPDLKKLRRQFVTQFFMENEGWIDREVGIFKTLIVKNNLEQSDKFIVDEFQKVTDYKGDKKAHFTEKYAKEAGK
jgi:hypothetical protein